MSPERLAAYVILAPVALWLGAVACIAVLRAACWLWETFAGVAAEAFPPEPEPVSAKSPEQQRAALLGLCSHIRPTTPTNTKEQAKPATTKEAP